MIIWLLLTCGIRYSTAQSSLPLNEAAYTDSLNTALQKAPGDSARSRIHFQLSEYWRSKDTLKSRNYLNKATQLAQASPFLKALIPYYTGQYYFSTNTAEAAVAFAAADTALIPFTTAEAYLFRSMAVFNYAIMERSRKGDVFVTDTWLNRAIPLAEKAGNDEKIAHYYTQLGTLFMSNAQFAKAAEYNNKAITLLESKHPQSASLLIAYLSAAGNEVYNNQRPQAKQHLDKARELLRPFPQSVNLPNFYYTEGLYYTSINEFDKAMASLDKGIALAQQLNQQQLLQMMIFRKYNILLESKNYTAALELLNKVVADGVLTKEVNNRKLIYQQLYTVNAAMGRMKNAYNWSLLYSQLNDSLHAGQLDKNIHELEIRYHQAENEKAITLLHAEKEKATLAARNNRLMNWLLGAAAALLLAIAAFLSQLYRSNRRQTQQRELNYQHQLRQAEREKKIEVTQALLQGEENERERVARDLHDGLGGMLAGIRLNLATLPAPANPDTPEFTGIIRQIDHSTTELRRIARNMMPETLLSIGLEEALGDLCNTLTTSSPAISYQPFNIDPALPRNTQVTIYRIVQEMLSNAVKHANATEIVLQFAQHKQTIYITIEDNGKGFDTTLISKSKGIGLYNIKKRVEYLNGDIEIITAANEGTTINIELNVAG